MHDYKVSINQGVRKFSNRQLQFNNYISYLPAKALSKKGESKVVFKEMNLRKLLDGALPCVFCNWLTSVNWDIYEEPYHETVSNLEAMESSIKKEYVKAKCMHKLKQTVKDIAEQKDKRTTTG